MRDGFSSEKTVFGKNAIRVTGNRSRNMQKMRLPEADHKILPIFK
jgi:hypothetical protein